jgi:hypothetical protein
MLKETVQQAAKRESLNVNGKKKEPLFELTAVRIAQ